MLAVKYGLLCSNTHYIVLYNIRMIGDHAEIPDWLVPGFYTAEVGDAPNPPDTQLRFNPARHLAAALCHASVDLFDMPDAPENVPPVPLPPPLVVRTADSLSPEEAAKDFLVIARLKRFIP